MSTYVLAAEECESSENFNLIHEEEQDPEFQKDSPVYRQYKRRYLLISLLFMCLCLNAEMWYNVPAATKEFTTFFGRNSTSDVNWLSNLYFLVYALTVIPCTYFVQRFGVRPTMMAACVLNFCATIFRLLSFALNTPNFYFSYHLVIVSNILGSLSQGFVFTLPSIVSNRWFGDNERDLSLSCLLMGDVTGDAIGTISFTIPLSLLSISHIKIISVIVSSFEMVISLVVLILACLFVEEYPPTHPSKTAMTQYMELRKMREIPKKKYLSEIIMKMIELLRNKSVLGIMIVFSFYYATPSAFYTFLNEILYDMIKLNPETVSEFIGFVGFTSVLLGGLSSICVSALRRCSVFQARAPISIGLFLMCGLILSLISACEGVTSVPIIICLVMFYGMFSTPFWAIGMEMVTETSFPVPPEISSNLAQMMGSCINVIMIFLPGLATDSNIKCQYFLIASAVIYILSGLYLFYTSVKSFKVKNYLRISESA